MYRVGETIFKTKEELNDHNKIVHENLDHILTEEEFDNLSKVNLFCLRKGLLKVEMLRKRKTCEKEV